ncbi:MAG: hypothetical protein HY231_13365 [Acidobacteria bacterium]|nr:hypothetical protein [Acidobacteriota bacterium]
MPATSHDFNTSVFVNCPFDRQYQSLFEAMIFTVQLSGFKPRCAREESDSGDIRLRKLARIISECRYGIHDISRVQPQIPRFNMPLELGMDLGCRYYGSPRQRRKQLLILDSDPHRYLRTISDLRGQDIESHHDDQQAVIQVVRNFLYTSADNHGIPGGRYIYRKFLEFQSELPSICRSSHLRRNEVVFKQLVVITQEWLGRYLI